MAHAPEALVWATASTSRCVCAGNPLGFVVPGYREGIRPHRSRGVIVGAETAGVGGVQRLAIVSRREAVDGVRARASSGWNNCARRL